MTHAELVIAARAWLTAKRFSVVITDMQSSASETPDAIGWNSFRSTLIECKASRADFKVDQHKPHRMHADQGMGNERFYMAPAGLLKKEDMPPGWGLLEVNPERKVRMRKESEFQKANKVREVSLLISALRRIGQNPPQGIAVKCYTLEAEQLATITIDPEPPPTIQG